MFFQIMEQFQGELSRYCPGAVITDREAWNSLDPEWREKTVSLGENYLGFTWQYLTAVDYMDFTRTGNRDRFEQRFFAKRKALSALVLAECVENKGRFLDDIVNGIFAICDENGWDLPAHNRDDEDFFPLPDLTAPIIDLFACETGAVISAAVYLLEPVLERVSPVIARRARYELERRIFQPYLERHFFWMGNGKDSMNNWTPWCTQNVLLAAFLAGDCQDRFRDILLKACRSMDYFLAEYGEDGCCDEGAQYYHHAGLCLSAVLRLCNAVTGGAFASIYEEPLIKNMAAYIYNMHVDDIYYVNFADCSPVAGRAGVREYLFAKETDNPDMMAFAADDFRRGMPGTLLLPDENNLFYRLQNAFTAAEIKAYREPVKTGPDIFYPSVQLMVVRDNRLFLAAKAGDNADSHNHNDVGSFTVYKDGQPLLIDVGVETYCKKTFSPQRYEIWTMQSSYHNLPQINGCMQQPGEAYRATEVVCDLQACRLDMELVQAYPPECGLRSYHRTAQLEKGKEIVITDTFSWREEEGAQKLVLNLMTSRKPEPEQDGESCCIRIGEGCLRLEGAHAAAIEEIPITDARLAAAWKDFVYRIVLEPEKEKMVMRIS